MALTANGRLLKLELLRLAADEPFALKPATCPLNNLPVFPATRLPNGSVFAIAESGYGIQIAYADEEMDTTAATPATANLLKLARNEPLIRIRQVIYSTKGKATLYVLGLYRSDRTTY